MKLNLLGYHKMSDIASTNFDVVWEEIDLKDQDSKNIENMMVTEMSHEEFLTEFGFDASLLDDSFHDTEFPVNESGSAPAPLSVLSEDSNVVPSEIDDPVIFTIQTVENPEFLDIQMTEVNNFIHNEKNRNTLKKTSYDLLRFQRFLKVKGEKKEIHEIECDTLDGYFANFLLSIKKKDGTDYEPVTIRSFVSSFERELRDKKYKYTIMGSHGPEFNLTREALKAKTKQLKKSGKGNKPQAAGTLTDEEVDILYEKGVLGGASPKSLLNTVWFNNCIHFGIRGTLENYNLRWGDIKLKKTQDGKEYLEFNERQTKTRTWENIADIRKVAPKIFSSEGERDPIGLYKLYASKRPENFSREQDPFYIAPTTKFDGNVVINEEKWFIKQKVGSKKLGVLLANMSKEAGISETKRITNHSARKHLVQKLRNANVDPIDIQHFSGHKNVSSILNYSEISEEKQKMCSDILSNTNSKSKSVVETVSAPRPACIHDVNVHDNGLPVVAGINSNTTAMTANRNELSMFSMNAFNSYFAGAVFNIQNFNMYHK